MLIARLTAERRCYEPERIDATRARIRHVGARRAAPTTEATAAVQQLRDLLECVWPGRARRSGQTVSVQDVVCLAGRRAGALRR